MTAQPITTPRFAFCWICQHGTVLIVEDTSGWSQVFFSEKWTEDDEKELLGTFPSVQDAIDAARSGMTEIPEIGIELKDMELPKDPNDWDQHFNRVASA